MSRPDELHAAFGDGARRHGFEFGADFVNDDDLRHVVFHGFYHYGVLFVGGCHLHAP